MQSVTEKLLNKGKEERIGVKINCLLIIAKNVFYVLWQKYFFDECNQLEMGIIDFLFVRVYFENPVMTLMWLLGSDFK